MSNVSNSGPNVLEELFKSLNVLNDQLELNTILPHDVSVNLIEIIEVAGKIANLRDVTDHQLEQLNFVCAKLVLLMKISLAPAPRGNKKMEETNCVKAVQAPPHALPAPPAKDVLEEFLHEPNSCGFVGVCGMDAMLQQIRAMFILPLRQPQLFPPHSTCRNLLLYGPPGCGKTHLVHALSVALEAKLYCLTPGNLMSKYVGETEKLVQKVFEDLRERTEITVLFIDELDAFCCSRKTNEAEYNRRVKIEFMHQLAAEASNSKLIVVAATNMPWDIDTAVVRRFQQQLHLGLPRIEQRGALLQYYMGDAAPGGPYDATQLWAHLLENTEGYSSSDLKEVVRAAMQKPIEELLEVTTWRLQDGLYVPSDEHEASITSSVYDLPPGSVRSRPMELVDLIITLGQVPRTVTDRELVSFQMYLDRSKKLLE